MNMTQAAVDVLVKPFEKFSATAYPDPGGIWTLGYGHTHGVTPGQVCTLRQANDWLAADASDAAELSEGAFWDANQDQFDCLCDMMFNIGPGRKDAKDGIIVLKSGEHSTLYKHWQAGDFAGVRVEIPKWNHQGGIELGGLTKRRAADLLWFGGAHPAQLG